MKDYIELGSSPYAEDCVQVSSYGDYLPQMREECQRYKEMLNKRFPEISGRFIIKTFPHDFGSYLEVCIPFDHADQLERAQAFFVEEHLPEKWTDSYIFTGFHMSIWNLEDEVEEEISCQQKNESQHSTMAHLSIVETS